MDEEAREGGSRWDPVFHSKEGFKLGGEEGRGLLFLRGGSGLDFKDLQVSILSLKASVCLTK